MHQGVIHRAGIQGVWALRALDSNAQFTVGEENTIKAALDFDPLMRGFSLRTGWAGLEPTQGNYNFAILDHARTVADSRGKSLAIRPAAGQKIPAWLAAQVRTWTNAQGNDVAHACLTNGSPNQPFLDAYRLLFEQVCQWCEANDVILLHGSWFGNLWNEAYGDAANHMPPVQGYDSGGNNWRAAHTAIITILHDLQLLHPTLTMELPSSGTYSAIPGGISGSFAQGVTLFGQNSPYWYHSENGVPTYHGLASNTTSRFAQMDKPEDYTQAEWTVLRDDFLIADHIDALEVYTNPTAGFSSFTGPNSGFLRSIIVQGWTLMLIDPTPAPPSGDLTGWMAVA